MKNKFYRSINFFDLSIFCAGRGLKDVDGIPIRFTTPMSLNEIISDLIDMDPFYDNPVYVPSVEGYSSDFLKSEGIPFVIYEDEDELPRREDIIFSKLYKNDTFQVYLQDIKEARDFYVLLINYTNVNTPHGVVRDIVTNKREEAELTENQGNDLSCHVIIFKDNIDGRQKCLAEQSGGLSVAYLSSFFNYLAFQVSNVKETKKKFYVNDPSGSLNDDGEIKKCLVRPKIEFQGYPSDAFIKDIEDGVVQSMKLIGEAKNFAGFDADIPSEFGEVGINISADLAKGSSWKDNFKAYFKKGKGLGLDRFRIRFLDSSGKTHTNELDLDVDLDSGDIHYVKKRRIGMAFRPKLSYNQLKPSFVKKILEVKND